MFLLHFLSSTKVPLAYFAQFCTVLEIRIFKEGRSRGGPKGLYNDKLKKNLDTFNTINLGVLESAIFVL